jgi:hypothetical protein
VGLRFKRAEQRARSAALIVPGITGFVRAAARLAMMTATTSVAFSGEPAGWPYDGGDAALSPQSAASLVLNEAEDAALVSLPRPEDLLTPADLPPRAAGFGNPLQAVHAVTQRAGGGDLASETRSFPAEDSPPPAFNGFGGGFIGSLEAMPSVLSTSLSLTDATEFTLPQWLQLGDTHTPPRPPLPPTRSGMATAPPVYTWCLRTTHSDVTCLVNTAQPLRDDAPADDALAAGYGSGGGFVGRSMKALKGLPSPLASPLAGGSGSKKSFDYRKEVKQCRLPYAGGKGGATIVLAKAKGTTLLAQQRDADRRAVLNAELKAERSAFLAKLAAERHGRLALEHAAAARLQALWRGFCGRPHSDAAASLQQHTRWERARARGEPSAVRAALRALDAASGLAELPGTTLPKRHRSKRVQKAEKAAAAAQAQAATVLQSRARMFTARAAAAQQAFARSAARQHAAAGSFQRVFRGGRVRLLLSRRTQDGAARAIQGAARRLLANKRAAVLLLALQEARFAQLQEARAATKFQALQRGGAARAATQGARADAGALREAAAANEASAAEKADAAASAAAAAAVAAAGGRGSGGYF